MGAKFVEIDVLSWSLSASADANIAPDSQRSLSCCTSSTGPEIRKRPSSVIASFQFSMRSRQQSARRSDDAPLSRRWLSEAVMILGTSGPSGAQKSLPLGAAPLAGSTTLAVFLPFAAIAGPQRDTCGDHNCKLRKSGGHLRCARPHGTAAATPELQSLRCGAITNVATASTFRCAVYARRLRAPSLCAQPTAWRLVPARSIRPEQEPTWYAL